MVDFLEYVEEGQVVDGKSFGAFCQQRTGTPLPNFKQLMILNKHSKEIFSQYPRANWNTLVQTVEWCLNNKKRFAHCYGYLSAIRYAWQAGYLPELDPVPYVDENLERRITLALESEQDEVWRGKLLWSIGPKARAEVFTSWWQERGPRGGS